MTRHLLIVDTTGNVMLADADNDIRMPIGAPLLPSQRSQVTTAVWSAQGQWTAWSVNSAEGDGIRQVRLHDEDSDQATVLVESVSAFYMNPSPCGRWLSHLSPGPLGLELALSDVSTGEIHVVERGQPMFWSWSPDSAKLAVHVEDRVVVVDIGDVGSGSSTRLLTDDAGPFITPLWVPGDSVLYAVDDRIVVAGPDDSVNTIVAQGSTGRFSLDPEGRRLAYIDVSRDNAALVVLDLISRTPLDVTSGPVVAFFWSPDGSKLAVLAAASGGQVQWLIAEGSDIERLSPFRPTRAWATSVLGFFEQYTQSHSCWSADGNTLVAPAVDEQGRSGALIHSVGALGDTQWIPDAQLAWWA